MCKLQTNRHISEINRGKSSSGSKLITNLTILTMPHVSTSPAPAIHQQQLATLHFLSENSCHSQNKCLWNKTIYFMMKKKVFKIIIKHSRTSMQDRPAQKVVQEIKNSLAIDCCNVSSQKLRRDTVLQKVGPQFGPAAVRRAQTACHSPRMFSYCNFSTLRWACRGPHISSQLTGTIF